MTIGRGMVVDSAWRSHVARSSSSAFSLSSRTTARRTEHTLIGSNLALRTSTRPLPSRPRRWCESGVDDSGPGGDCMILGRSIAVDRVLLRRWIGPQGADLFAVRREPADRFGDRRVVLAALEIGEEHVAAEALFARPRLDLREVHAAERELRQAPHEPPRLLRPAPPEHQRRLPRSG